MRREEKVGHIGVDAGLCWIGDPCYVIGEDASHAFDSWEAFLDRLYALAQQQHGEDNSSKAVTFPYSLGHDGLGVCVSTGYGDGTYPVYATYNEDGRCVEVRVDFDPEPEEPEDDEDDDQEETY